MFLFTLFFHCRSFFTLVAATISHFVTAAIIFSCFFPTKLVSVVIYFSLLTGGALDIGLRVVGVRTVGLRTLRHNQIFSSCARAPL